MIVSSRAVFVHRERRWAPYQVRRLSSDQLYDWSLLRQGPLRLHRYFLGIIKFILEGITSSSPTYLFLLFFLLSDLFLHCPSSSVRAAEVLTTVAAVNAPIAFECSVGKQLFACAWYSEDGQLSAYFMTPLPYYFYHSPYPPPRLRSPRLLSFHIFSCHLYE